MKAFKLIVCYKDKKLEVMANELIVNSEKGQLTILANHIPLITTIKAGKMEYVVDNKRVSFTTSDGLLEVNKDQVMVFADFNKD